jgi:hypothetical protein
VPSAQQDLLAAAVLDQQPLEQLPQAARDALARLPELFPITVRVCVALRHDWAPGGVGLAAAASAAGWGSPV